MRLSHAALLGMACGCGSTPGNVSADQGAADTTHDSFVDGGDARPSCDECPGAVTFLLNEKEAPDGYLRDTGGSVGAWIADPGGILLGQPGPPGFGNALCFTGGLVQYIGSAFQTIAPAHTLEFVIQPLQGGLALRWLDDDAGWKVWLDNLAMAFSFCAADCGTPSYTEGTPRWIAGQWYHAAIVRDGDTVRTYLGAELNAELSGHATNPVATPFGLSIGPNDLTFQGCLAWLRLLPCACYTGSTITPPDGEPP